jgi:hypothetical protein
MELWEIREEFEIGKFYFAFHDQTLAATFRLTDRPEWYRQIGSNENIRKDIAAQMNISKEELSDRIRKFGLDQPAMHWHTFAVKREFKGQGLGHKLLGWGEVFAYQQGFEYLRLDCHHLNERLRQHYVDANFESLHVVGENPFGGIFQKRLSH